MATEPTWRPASWWHALILAGLGIAAGVRFLYDVVLRRPVLSYDGPWHLWVGRAIDEAGRVPTADPICFTTEGLTWINPDWLAQWIEFRAFLIAGFNGPLAIATSLYCLTILVAWLGLRRLRASPIPGAAVLFASGFFLIAALSIRPRMFSLLGVAATAWILALPDPDLRLGPRRAGGLLAVLLPWLHLHGGFVYGFVVMTLDGVGSCVDSRRRGGPWIPRRTRWLVGVCAAGVLGFALHPNGWAPLVRIVEWRLSSSYAEVLAGTTEMTSLGFLTLRGGGVVVLAALWVAGHAAAPRAAVRWGAVLPVVYLFSVALSIQRMATPWVLVALPSFAVVWTAALERAREASPRGARWIGGVEDRLRLLVTAAGPALAATLVLWLALGVPGRVGDERPGDLSPALDASRLPVGAAAYLRRSAPAGRIFNPFEYGGLLGWVLYPQRRIYIDGRTGFHCFEGDLWERFQRIYQLQPGWREQLDADRIEWAVVPASHRLVPALREAGWAVRYQDALAVVLQRPAQRAPRRAG